MIYKGGGWLIIMIIEMYFICFNMLSALMALLNAEGQNVSSLKSVNQSTNICLRSAPKSI